MGINNKLTGQQLMKIIRIDNKTLARFKEIQRGTIKEAALMGKKKSENTRIKVLGISGSARDKNDMAQEESNSEELLKICLKHCKKLGADSELIKLREYRIEHCKACYSTTNTQCHFYCSCYPKGTPQADDMSNILYDKVLEADCIIFATPVNNFNVSTPLKAFIDRCISLDGSLKPANPKVPKNRELNIKHMKFVELTADNNVPGSGMLRRFIGKVAGIIVTGHEEGASMVISNLFMTFNHFGMLFPPFSNMYAMSSVCNSTYEDKKDVLAECYVSTAKLIAENVMNAAQISRNTKRTDWKYDYDSD
jgi:multimeric flavodoxin WrbA